MADLMDDLMAGGPDALASNPTAMPDAAALGADGPASQPVGPLDGREISYATGLRVSAPPLRGMISVKADLTSPDVGALLSQLVGEGALPPRKARFRGETGALWMAPDELLIMTPRAQASAVAAHAELALSEIRRLVVDVSDMRSVIRLVGPGAREILAKGAPVDLHPESFRTGDLRRTRLSSVAAALYQLASTPETFEIVCFRSYAPAVWDWLAASSDPAAAPGVFPGGVGGVGL